MLQGLKNGYLFQFAVLTTIKDKAFLSASNCPLIKFLRSGSGKYNQSPKGFQSSAIQQLVKLLMELGNLPSPARNRRRPR